MLFNHVELDDHKNINFARILFNKKKLLYIGTFLMCKAFIPEEIIFIGASAFLLLGILEIYI